MSCGVDRAACASTVRAASASPDLVSCRERSRDSLPNRAEPNVRLVSTITEKAFMSSPPATSGHKPSRSQFTSQRGLVGFYRSEPQITTGAYVNSERIYDLLPDFVLHPTCRCRATEPRA